MSQSAAPPAARRINRRPAAAGPKRNAGTARGTGARAGAALGSERAGDGGRAGCAAGRVEGPRSKRRSLGKTNKTEKQRPLGSVVRHHRGAFYCKETKTTASALAGPDTSVCIAQGVARAGGQPGVQQEGGLREGGRAGLTESLPAGQSAELLLRPCRELATEELQNAPAMVGCCCAASRSWSHHPCIAVASISHCTLPGDR